MKLSWIARDKISAIRDLFSDSSDWLVNWIPRKLNRLTRQAAQWALRSGFQGFLELSSIPVEISGFDSLSVMTLLISVFQKKEKKKERPIGQG